MYGRSVSGNGAYKATQNESEEVGAWRAYRWDYGEDVKCQKEVSKLVEPEMKYG